MIINCKAEAGTTTTLIDSSRSELLCSSAGLVWVSVLPSSHAVPSQLRLTSDLWGGSPMGISRGARHLHGGRIFHRAAVSNVATHHRSQMLPFSFFIKAARLAAVRVEAQKIVARWWQLVHLYTVLVVKYVYSCFVSDVLIRGTNM